MLKKNLNIKTRYGTFQCLFEPEKDMGGCMVEARGVPGAISWGKNLAEARNMIKEAIEGAVEAGAVIRAEKSGLVSIRNTNRVATVA